MKKLLILLVVFFALGLAGCEKRDISVTLHEGYDIIGLYSAWEDSGCTLKINSELEYDMDIHTTELDITALGEYEIVYLKEYGGTSYQCKRIVKVVDDEAPFVALNSGLDTVKVNTSWTDSGIIAVDNVDSELDIVVTGSVDITTVGTYTLIYTVTDDYANFTKVTRIVHVIE